MMNPVVVAASTMMELSQLLEAGSASPIADSGHLQAYRGVIGGKDLIFAVTGVGKVNAASAGTLLLERFKPSLLINIGCGGAFPGSGLAVGDLAVASRESFADEGVQTPGGWRGLDLIGIPLLERRGERVFNTIELSPELAGSASDHARRNGFTVVSGPFLTVSTCSGTDSRGVEMMRRFSGICENMEGAAFAQVALLYDVPFLEVRGISNMVEDRDLSRWDLKRGVGQPQKFLLDYLQSRHAA